LAKLEEAERKARKSAQPEAAKRDNTSAGQQLTAKQAFRAANRLIDVRSGRIAHGNTRLARRIARQYARKLRMEENASFKGGKKNRILSMTGDDFLTYCRISGSRIVLLVHVPQLKRYTREGRRQLLDLAWMVAVDVLYNHLARPEVPLEALGYSLAVGLRGAVFYGAVATGKAGLANPKPSKTYFGLRARAKTLHPFFVDPKPSPPESLVATYGLVSRKIKQGGTTLTVWHSKSIRVFKRRTGVEYGIRSKGRRYRVSAHVYPNKAPHVNPDQDPRSYDPRTDKRRRHVHFRRLKGGYVACAYDLHAESDFGPTCEVATVRGKRQLQVLLSLEESDWDREGPQLAAILAMASLI
jgi:hypothetical protein